MKKLIGAVLVLFLAVTPAYAGWDDPVLRSGSDVELTGTTDIEGPMTVTETVGSDVITDSTFATACGAGNWTCSGAWAIADGTATRTANASNLALVSTTAVDEGATGTWYRWDITTNLTAGTLTPSFCGQTLTAISATGATTTTYRLFCPYQAAALGVPTLTAVAATEGTVTDAPLYPITSTQSGTGLAFKAGTGGFHVVLGASWAEVWQGADLTGIRVHGYDDKQASTIYLAVASNGAGYLSANDLITFFGVGFTFQPSGIGDFQFIADADSIFQIGDGTYSWGHSPQVGVEGVAEFDSKAWFDAGLNIAGQATVSGTAPAVGTCGTTPAIASGSTDHAGLVTVGSGATTACTLTFAVAYANEPVCVVSTEANVTAYISAKSTTAMTVTFSADAASQQWDYVCFGL